VVNGVVVFGLL